MVTKEELPACPVATTVQLIFILKYRPAQNTR